RRIVRQKLPPKCVSSRATKIYALDSARSPAKTPGHASMSSRTRSPSRKGWLPLSVNVSISDETLSLGLGYRISWYAFIWIFDRRLLFPRSFCFSGIGLARERAPSLGVRDRFPMDIYRFRLPLHESGGRSG